MAAAAEIWLQFPWISTSERVGLASSLSQVWTVECGSEREGAEEDVFAVDVKLRAHARDFFQVCAAGVMECYRVVCPTAK